MSESDTKTTGVRKTRVGIVISTSMDKTIVVEYTNRVPHPRFKKIIKRSKKFYAHDEEGAAAVGDKVSIIETKPISKKKCWKLQEILTH
jgi:small subunit ribosomal protein S17